MILKDLLKKFKLDFSLEENLLNKEITGKYTGTKKDKRLLNVLTDKGLVKQVFDCTIIYGESCECIIAPSCNYQTVKVSYKFKNIPNGYSYNRKGYVSSIV